MSEAKKAQSMLTKKRYNDLKNILTEIYGADNRLEDALMKFCDMMRFDPEASTYNEKVAQQIKQYRERKKAEGVPIYVSSGNKASYHKRKAAREANQNVT